MTVVEYGLEEILGSDLIGNEGEACVISKSVVALIWQK